MSNASKTDPLVIGLGVILMLGVAVLVLFPVFIRTNHGSARKVSCQSNMKELGSAFYIYCEDYNNILPSSALRGSKTWNDQEFSKFATIHGGNGTSPTLISLLEKYCRSNPKDLFWCPSDPMVSGNPLAVVSYWYKAANDKAWFNSIRKLDDYQYPADQVLMYEHASWHWGAIKNGLSNGVRLNYVFMDGHVSVRCLANAGNALGKSSPVAPGEPAWYNQDWAKDKPLGKGTFCNPRTQGDKLWLK